MNIKNITLLGLLSLFLASCYSDKGNYDYIAMNDFDVKLNPAPPNNRFTYLVNQPVGDTVSFTLKADINQTLTQGDKNLEYLWTSTIGGKTDSIYTSSITLKIPPAKRSTFSLMVKVRDKDLDIEYRQFATVMTQIPFHDAWLVLHGDMGDRKIGAIQWDSQGDARWEDDMMTVSKRPQIKNATDIAYSTTGTFINNDYLRRERLLVQAGSDSIVNFLPFDVIPSKYGWPVMRPVDNPTVKIDRLVAHGRKENVGMLDVNGKFYWARIGGFFYSAISKDVPNYHVDEFYINQNNVATLWDDNAKRFMYYTLGNNNYSQREGAKRQDNNNTTEITYCEDVKAGEMKDKTVLWAGKGAKSSGYDVESCLFVVKDKNTKGCFLYEFHYDEWGGSEYSTRATSTVGPENNLMELKRDTLTKIRFADDALFATSDAFNEQIFYTDDNQLFRCIKKSEEVIPLMIFEGRIKEMRFRITTQYGLPDVSAANMRTLGIVIEGKNGKDTFKEIIFSTGADIIKVKEYDYDFGKIQRIDFSATERRFDV